MSSSVPSGPTIPHLATDATSAPEAAGQGIEKQPRGETLDFAFGGPVHIQCPPERHIAVQFTDLFKELNKGQLKSLEEQDSYKLVAELIESLYAQEFMTLRRNLKQNFLMFSVGAKDQTMPSRVGKSLPNTTELDDKESKLVNDITQLMAAARFHIMTEEEWTLALCETFKFNLPVDINWEFFDGKFLTKFWASNQERSALRSVLSPIADKVLVFHRGIGVSEDSGLYLNEKLDLLIEYCIANTLKSAWETIKGFFPWNLNLKRASKDHNGLSPRLIRTNARSWRSHMINSMSSQGHAAHEAIARIESEEGGASGARTPRSHTPPQSMLKIKREPEVNEGGLASGMRHRNAQIVERKTMRRIMPTASLVIANVFQTIKLQEPMFKEVVVVYRTSGQGRTLAKDMSKQPLGFGKDNATRLRHILQRRNIHIKYFHDIPIADIEAVFPDKKVYSKSISIISMVFQAVMAFVAALATMWQAGALTFQTIWSVLSLVGARAGQMYSRMQYERSRVMQDMVNILYDKMNDAQEGVLSMLLEDMAEQQLKEAVLAYTLLLSDEGEMTEEALDDKCEQYLEETYDCRIDFAVEDALPQLVEWGLVEENKRTGTFKAVGVHKAKEALTVHWTHAYEAINKPPSLKQLPLYSLLPGGETELLRAGVIEEELGNACDSSSIVSKEEDTATQDLKIGITPDGRAEFVPKKNKGPMHKLNKTFKSIFSDGDGTKSKKPSSGGKPAPAAVPPPAKPAPPAGPASSGPNAPVNVPNSHSAAQLSRPSGPVAQASSPQVPAPPLSKETGA